MAKHKQIILYLGSFNPIHIGHTALASYVMDFINADEIWFVVSPHNPLKETNEIRPIDERVRIIKKTLKGCDKYQYCSIENILPTPYYTIRSLRSLDMIYPDYQFNILMGADSYLSLNKWHKGMDIKKQYPLVVYPRKGYELPKDEKIDSITFLNEAPIIEVSSSMIRKAIRDNRDLKFFLAKAELWDEVRTLYEYKNR